MERHETYTDYNLSVALKLTIARFINSSIVPLVANIALEDWFDDGGLVSTIFYVILSLSFLDPLMDFVSPFYMIRLIKRCLSRSSGRNSVMSQADANL